MPEKAAPVQVRYEENLVRKTVRTFVWRRFVLEQKLLWVAAGAMLLLCTWLLTQGDRSWLALLAGASPLLPLMFVFAGWGAHLRASLARFRALPDATAKFTFDAEGFGAMSAVGEMRLPWSSVSEVWARPDFWMFLIAPNQFVTLPTKDVPGLTLDRLRDWLGAKVIDL